VAIRGRFSVDRPLKIEIPDKTTWAEVEVPEHDLKKSSVASSSFTSSVGIDMNAERMCYTNCIGNLDESTIAKISCYK